MLSLLKIESLICQSKVQEMFLATRFYARNKSLSCKQVHFCKNSSIGKTYFSFYSQVQGYNYVTKALLFLASYVKILPF